MAANWWDLLLTGLAGVAAFVSVGAALIRALILVWRATEFTPGHFARARLKALMEMRADTQMASELTDYLDSELELEKFRVASGVSANQQQMAALLKLFRLGIWEREEVRSAARYLKVSPLWQHPRIQIEKTDELEAISALVISVALPVSGALVWAAMIVKLPIYGFLLGAVAFLLSVLMANWVGRAHGDLRSAKRIKSYLDDNPHILQSTKVNAPSVKAAA